MGRSIRKMFGDSLVPDHTSLRRPDTHFSSIRRCSGRCWLPTPMCVLSTSWVRVLGSVRKVARRLPRALRARVVGATFHGEMDAYLFAAMPRGMQVWADVQRRRPHGWLSLDDDGEGWPAMAREHLVLTDPVLGISEPSVYSAIQEKLAALGTPGGACDRSV
ncbi:HAD domain-containing protein [Paraburkholderia panacisoli]|uniref:HAD domain-containing protein n=1 Tax=Paraburkholderia panacisoli TaxID=2603818 RepID=UPI00319E767B